MFKLDQKRIIAYTAVSALLVFLYLLGPLKPVEAYVTKYASYAATRLAVAGNAITRLYRSQTDRSDAAERLQSLESKVSELTVENARLKSLEEENRVLREQLGFFANNKYRYLMADVVARGDLSDQSEQTETIIINKGKNDGVEAGQAVLSANGVIIGKTTAVKDSLAQVYLTNNAKCKLAATILSQSNTSGIAQGELGLTIRMDFIPQSVNIKPEDIVITSGLEQAIPRGLVIGRVLSVKKESNDLWQSATIEPLGAPENLNIVSVITP